MMSQLKEMSVSMPGSLRKDMTRNQNNDIPVERAKSREFGCSNPMELRLAGLTPPTRSVFVIKTFQNSLESKAQRQARQKSAV